MNCRLKLYPMLATSWFVLNTIRGYHLPQAVSHDAVVPTWTPVAQIGHCFIEVSLPLCSVVWGEAWRSHLLPSIPSAEVMMPTFLCAELLLLSISSRVYSFPFSLLFSMTWLSLTTGQFCLTHTSVCAVLKIFFPCCSVTDWITLTCYTLSSSEGDPCWSLSLWWQWLFLKLFLVLIQDLI